MDGRGDGGDPARMTPTFDTKAALVLDETLPAWQRVNVAAFLFSGFGAVGERYRDADGNEYLPMLREPVMVFGSDGAGVRRAYERARARGVEELAIFTRELFETRIVGCCQGDLRKRRHGALLLFEGKLSPGRSHQIC